MIARIPIVTGNAVGRWGPAGAAASTRDHCGRAQQNTTITAVHPCPGRLTATSHTIMSAANPTGAAAQLAPS